MQVETNSLPLTRIEVIDHSGLGGGQGRILTEYYQGPVNVTIMTQDDDRTLKIFIKNQDESTD